MMEEDEEEDVDDEVAAKCKVHLLATSRTAINLIT